MSVVLMDRRARYRQRLHSLYLPFYDVLCSLLPVEWAPYDGHRTFAQQDALYAQGRTLRGPLVTNAKGGESAHCYGCANDWTIWNGPNPLWLTKEDPRWATFVDAVTRAGLRSGAEFGDIDHCELKINCGWHAILEVFETSGGDLEIVTATLHDALEGRLPSPTPTVL